MTLHPEISQHQITANGVSFATTVVTPEQPVRCVVFAAGRGGMPSRHLPLLNRLAEAGCIVVAPHFNMLAPTKPSASELYERIRWLEVAMDEYAPKSLHVVGVGHSIGTVVLLTLAGAHARVFNGDSVTFQSSHHIERLALMSPPTNFFLEAKSLDEMRANVHVWVGQNDVITPPTQAALLTDRLSTRALVMVEDNADHFTYMDERPPHAAETHPDAIAFRTKLAGDIVEFVMDEPMRSHNN